MILNYLKVNPIIQYDDYVEVDSKNLPVGKFKIIALEKDYYGTEDFNDFVDRYVKE